MAFLRSVVTTKPTATAATAAIPAAFAVACQSSSPSPPHSPCSSSFKRVFNELSFGSLKVSLNPIHSQNNLVSMKSFAMSSVAVEMDQYSSAQNGAVLPDLLTEFMVDMKCEGCVNSVKNKLQPVDGVKNVDADLTNQVVRVLGTSPVKILTEALEQTGRKARLIGQGVPEVRLAQVNMELARIEADFSGLPPGKHGWSINEFGDLTKGASSTGKVFNPTNHEKEALGDLGTLDVDEKGEAFFSGVKVKLRVGDLIGRAIVVYATEDKSDEGVTAAVVARSAGVGENYKTLCTCDGTTIWEATNSDFVTTKV